MPRTVRSRAVAGAVLALGGLTTAGLAVPAAGASAATTRPVVLSGCLPPYSLAPSASDGCSSPIVDALFTGLVVNGPRGGAPVPAMAQRISSADNRHWTVTLRPGMTFSDRSPVDARSFVDAWDWTAYGPHATDVAYLLAPIAGYAAAQGGDRDGDGKVSAAERPVRHLSGLHVVNARTFTITLSAPWSVFPTMLGQAAFSPLPREFFRGPAAFARHPVGNGPFVLSRVDRTGWRLAARKGYRGPDPAGTSSVFVRGFSSFEDAYRAFRGHQVDWMAQVPVAAVRGGAYRTAAGAGHWRESSIGVIQTVTVPVYDPDYADPNLAKALSLAIDRGSILEEVFGGARRPATGWVAPGVDGYKAGACGPFCHFDPEAARAYLARVTNKPAGTSFAYNVDGEGNAATAEAVCRSITAALDLICTAKPYPTFAGFRGAVEARKMQGLFRTGWFQDYPSIEDYLTPLYSTGAANNDNSSSDPAFDALLRRAAASRSRADANVLYQQAEARLSRTMSVIPLWYTQQQSVWSPRLSHVRTSPTGELDLSAVRAR